MRGIVHDRRLGNSEGIKIYANERFLRSRKRTRFRNYTPLVQKVLSRSSESAMANVYERNETKRNENCEIVSCYFIILRLILGGRIKLLRCNVASRRFHPIHRTMQQENDKSYKHADTNLICCRLYQDDSDTGNTQSISHTHVALR